MNDLQEHLTEIFDLNGEQRHITELIRLSDFFERAREKQRQNQRNKPPRLGRRYPVRRFVMLPERVQALEQFTQQPPETDPDRLYRQRNRARLAEHARIMYQRNRERLAARQRAYYHTNPSQHYPARRWRQVMRFLTVAALIQVTHAIY